MGTRVRHKFTNPKADGSDATIVRPSNWNDDHDLVLVSRVVAGTTDTLVPGDDNGIVKYTSATAVTVTLPANLPVDFNTTLIQAGAGQVAWTAASGATIPAVRPAGATKTAGAGAEAGVLVAAQGSNYASGATGTAAAYFISGDLA
jgi:hypothetical protein